MKKGFQVLSITYLLKIALEISMLVVLNTYFKISSIPIFLIGLFNIDLGKFTVVKWLSILFIIFIIINNPIFLLFKKVMEIAPNINKGLEKCVNISILEPS